MHDKSRYQQENKVIDEISLNSDEDDDEFDSESDSLPELEETLSKWTNYLHGWQDRWVVLRDGTLSYYRSQNGMNVGCRGSISLASADVEPHEFDECRFDIGINDNIWYIKAKSVDIRQKWLDAIEAHKAQASKEDKLNRHGSMMSLNSGSLISTSSFKKGRNLREKLAEMETFRDILCRQVDTLQGYFDNCAEAATANIPEDLSKKWLEDPLDEDILEDDELIDNENVSKTTVNDHQHTNGPSKDKFQKPSSMGIDFRGEAFTFKATTGGILATLSHCIDLMRQREEQWQKRLEKEQDRRKRAVEEYKKMFEKMKGMNIKGGPDFEEGPYSKLKEEEFFDAIESALDLNDQLEDQKVTSKESLPPMSIHDDRPPHPHRLLDTCNEKVEENLKYAFENIESTWDLFHSEPEMKIYKCEVEKDGVVCDPLKAIHTVRNITAYELCFYFWDVGVRMDWDTTLDSSKTLEVLSPDTVISHQFMRRVWPATQRDTCFASHIRKVNLTSQSPDEKGSYIVVNYSIDHPEAHSRCIRATINVSMLCQTFVDPPTDDLSTVTRDQLKCKIIYVAHSNPGGWVPASVLRTVYKREYPKFLRRFSAFVQEITKDKEIKW
ncbi:ceramide transfer protein-like [Antedon mediterranea]|uniref:ceramide transfer protein-like n=1 Tax=Antedon mediterranea TaxID=105859 RepID=UPI003AF678EA